MNSPAQPPDNRQRPADADLRDLTLIGKAFGVLSVTLVISGAFAFYHWQPRYLGLHIYGSGPALICAIPLLGVAVGFFKVSQALCESVGLDFVRRNAPMRQPSVPDDLRASPDDYPCSARVFQSRQQRIHRLPKLAKAAFFLWGMPVMLASFVSYDHWVGARANGLTDVLFFSMTGLLSLGPMLYLGAQANSLSTVKRYGLICPQCSALLIGEAAAHVSQTQHCPGCNEMLVEG